MIERRKVSNITIAFAEHKVGPRKIRKMAIELAARLARGKGPETGFDEPIELVEVVPGEHPDPWVKYRIIAGADRYEAWCEARTMRSGGMPDFNSLVCVVHRP